MLIIWTLNPLFLEMLIVNYRDIRGESEVGQLTVQSLIKLQQHALQLAKDKVNLIKSVS